MAGFRLSESRAGATLVLLVYGLIVWRALPAGSADEVGRADFIVAFATERGAARTLAEKSAGMISQQGFRVVLTELNQLASHAQPAEGVLVIASTTGRGVAPRNGVDWLKEGDLPEKFGHCRHGVLALGDRSYKFFCGFGHEVARVFRETGSPAYWEMIQVHRQDPQSVALWFAQVETLLGDLQAGRRKSKRVRPGKSRKLASEPA